jgi:acyl-CoA thioesterase I
MSFKSLKPGSVVVFQGDSITDCGRSREDNSLLGDGYANFIAALLNAKHPELELTFINRGVGGDRVYDLEKRWTEDCIAFKPDLVSILVGVNDTWRRYDSDIESPIPEFEASYRRMLDRVKSETTADIIILEPFLLELPHVQEFRADLGPRISCIRKIARDYGTPYVPLDGIFAAASTKRPPEFWASDGVHPTPAGHALIAMNWLKAIKG